MECKNCELHQFMRKLGKIQLKDNPAKINKSMVSSDNCTLIVLPAPGMDQEERMRTVIRLMAKHYRQYKEHDVYVSHAVCCNYPPNSNLTKKHVSACNNHLLAHIEGLRSKYNNLYILAAGRQPIDSLKLLGFKFNDVNKTDISFNRLSTFKTNPYNASVFVCNNVLVKTGLTGDELTLAQDLNYMSNSIEGKVVTKKPKTKTIMTVDDVKWCFDYMQKKVKEGNKYAAFDTETNTLDIYSEEKPLKIGLAQFSFEPAFGFGIPIEHSEVSDSMKNLNWKLLEFILKSNKIEKVCHNGMYDVRVAYKKGLAVNNYTYDTICMHGLIDSEERHGLSLLARQFTLYGAYDAELEQYKEANPECDPKRGGNYLNMPLNILSPYGIIDAVATQELFIQFRQQLQDMELLDFYNNLLHPLQLALLRISHTGMRMDLGVLKHYYNNYIKLKDELYEKHIRTHPMVKAFEESWEKNEDYFEYIKDPESWKKLNPRKRKIPEYNKFNPGSSQQLGVVFSEFCGYPVLKSTKTGPSYSKDVREYLMSLPEENNMYGVSFDLVKAVEIDAKASKEYSTYIKPFYEGGLLDRYSRLHPEYKTYGAGTGRLSCSNPNLQQIPRSPVFEDFKIKKLYVPPKGKIIVQGDYSQAELRVLAAITEDPAMMKSFIDGVDLHLSTAASVFFRPIEELSKDGPERQAAKAVNFGIVYGMTPFTLAGTFYNTLKGDHELARKMYNNLAKKGYVGNASLTRAESKINGLNVKMPEIFIKLASAIMDRYFDTYKNLQPFFESVHGFTEENGYSCSAFGRRRKLPNINSKKQNYREEAKRQAVNHVIQSTAADLTHHSIIKLDNLLQNDVRFINAECYIISTVHDSIVFEMKEDAYKELIPVIKETMEDTSQYDWLCVPMKTDFEVGYSYGNLEEIEV